MWANDARPMGLIPLLLFSDFVGSQQNGNAPRPTLIIRATSSRAHNLSTTCDAKRLLEDLRKLHR